MAQTMKNENKTGVILIRSGSRQCIGNNFALVEAQLIFVTLVVRYRLGAAPEYPLKLAPTATQNHAPMSKFRPRCQASLDSAKQQQAAELFAQLSRTMTTTTV